MADGTGIQWTDATWNPTRGCSRVSPGCDNCYAMRQARRQSGPGAAYEGLTVLRTGRVARPGVDWSGKVVLVPSALDQPLRWRKPRRIFVNSMSDLFHPALSNQEIAAVFGVMAACPQHTFQVLTKRPERAAAWFKWLAHDCEQVEGGEIPQAVACGIHAANYGADVDYLGLPAAWPLPNVWLGVSAENQETYSKRVPKLVHEVPAAVHWASLEPLLGPIELRGTGRIHLDWFVVGGESGNGARPCNVEWIRALLAEAREADVAAFVKQLGRHPQIDPSERSEADREDARAACRRAKGIGTPYPNDEWRAFMKPWRLKDSHGGDPAEWPEDLRVRQFPQEHRTR